ncbi:homeobox-leucine zipper protein ROC8-like isoform X2 [Actinidia eriantha]|uniref:homeobox-leucine zipper protein ROC8-like isoform X2 n=1 Tax=Actinidia eriantha TaxID=165200 RepID=UPI00258840EB|nr:homeobox-leucine zipper protein ROC8-like isoform X2 [Actinidia eriantha]
MDFAYGGNVSGSGDEQEASNRRRSKKHYHRHTSYQIQQLEAFFKECPHPDDTQRRQLSRELGLDPKQIKFWFQNKRTQTKAQTERADNNALRLENEKIQCENLAFKEALKNVICPTCGGPPVGEEERQLNLQKLRMENSQLKQDVCSFPESLTLDCLSIFILHCCLDLMTSPWYDLQYERCSHMIANVLGKPVEQIQSLSRSLGLQTAGFPGQGLLESSSLGHDFGNSNNCPMEHQLNGTQEMEKSAMIDIAASAMDELIRLLRVNEPVWIKSPIDGRYVLHRESYNKLFPRLNHFKSSTTRMESSKDLGVVAMSAMHLLDMFLDSNKWVDLFPTMVTKARTIEVIDTRMLGDQAGSLQLMYEQMHILSPLVAPREFYFLRYCREIEPSIWVMVDVSYDGSSEDPHAPSLRPWRLPSGCMVQEKSSGCCEVTWVEHVEVDDKSQTHRLYRDLVSGGSAYGAQRWIVTLQRMSERLAFALAGTILPSHELGGVIDLPEGRRSIMDLSHRMVKNFWAMLSMSGKLDFPHLSELNNSGVRVSVRQSNEPGQPCGMVVSAASSLWLPRSCEDLLNFFRDEKTRSQWDVLSSGNPVHEIAHISCGTHPGNCISIIQESCIDPLGSLVIYAPIDFPAIKSAINGEDSTNIPILPSGFIISGDGRPEKLGSGASTSTSSKRTGGSLLTVAFQILVCTLSHSKQLSMESVATVNTLVCSTVQKIKATLDCSNVD